MQPTGTMLRRVTAARNATPFVMCLPVTLITSHRSQAHSEQCGRHQSGRRAVLTSHHRMTQVSSASHTTPADLPRVLGASQATAIVVGFFFGCGFFFVLFVLLC